ncbi:MAG: tripartite tricarboxylate transporter TctB family protein [Smithellaceae bacterium]|nr:tripartite tricarboxylate transporter TctB family protein [Smithellaceae bacterium]
MRRCNQVVGVLLLVFSILVIYQSRDLVYAVEFSPGAGFFPFWLGISLLLLSLILLLNSTLIKSRLSEGNPFPDRQALLRVLCILGSLLISILFFERLGFLIVMVLFIAFLLIFLEKYRWYSGVLISLVMVFAVYGLFKIWLGVPLPPGLIR